MLLALAGQCSRFEAAGAAQTATLKGAWSPKTHAILIS